MLALNAAVNLGTENRLQVFESDVLLDLFLVFTVEWLLTREQDEKQNACTPNITFAIIRVSQNDLRSHIAQTTDFAG